MREFYKEEALRRTKIIASFYDDKRLIPAALEFCSVRENIIDWIIDWCWTFDPRNANIGISTTIPWIPWPKQIEFIEWFYNHYINRESGLVEKARDAGATFLFCLIFLREWRWVGGFGAGIGSNKLENVDKRDNPKAIFPKMRSIYENLPSWWMPVGFDRKKHDNVANLINPENHSNISGEGGDDIGRGDRRSVYFVDEAASLEHFMDASSALSRTTNSIFWLSTPKGMNEFGKLRYSGRIDVFTFDWKSDPRVDQEWFDHFSAEHDPVVVAQEVLIDYHASVEGICIPAKWVNAAVELELPVSSVDAKTAGVDVAAGGKNRSAYVMRHGAKVMKVLKWNFETSTEVGLKAIEEGEKDCIHAMGFDAIGVGDGMKGILKVKEEQPRFRYYALSGNDSVKDEYWPEYQKHASELFLNARAERWIKVKKRFEKAYKFRTTGERFPANEMISIPNNPELIGQLSTPLEMHTESGKIKIESKDHMLSRGVDSPDLADALVYAFSVDTAVIGEYLLYGFDYTPKYDKFGLREKAKESFTKFSIEWGVVNSDPNKSKNNWGSTYFDKNFNISHISAYWNPYKKKLYVYDSFTLSNRTPETVAGKIKQSMGMCSKQRNLYLEEDAPKGVTDNTAALYKKCGVQFIVNPKYDEMAGVYAANQMFLKRQIVVHEVHEDCKRQFSLWTRETGKAKRSGFGLCFALCNLISMLKESHQLDEKPEWRGYSPNIPKPFEHDINPLTPKQEQKPDGMADYFG